MWKIFEGKMFTRSQTTTPLQIFCQLLLYSQVIFKSIRVADDTFQRKSECEWVNQSSCGNSAIFLSLYNPSNAKAILVRSKRMTPPLTARCLLPLHGFDPGLGMWESCQWLGVGRWFSPGTPLSSTTYDWLVTY